MKKLFLLVLLVATPAYAKPADRAAVMDLMKLVIPEASYTQMVDQMSSQMLAQLKQAPGSNLPADASKRLKDTVLEVAPYEEQLGWAADIYQQKFSAEEIADLRKFYETPTGKKAAKLLPEIMGEVGKRSGSVIQQRIPAALKKHGLIQ